MWLGGRGSLALAIGSSKHVVQGTIICLKRLQDHLQRLHGSREGCHHCIGSFKQIVNLPFRCVRHVNILRVIVYTVQTFELTFDATELVPVGIQLLLVGVFGFLCPGMTDDYDKLRGYG